MLNSIKLNKVHLGALFFLSSFTLSAQISIVDREFSTNYQVNNFFSADVKSSLIELDDSTLIYSLYKGGFDNVTARVVYYWVNKTDLSIRDSNIAFMRDTSLNYYMFRGSLVSFGCEFLTDQKWPSNNVYFESYMTDDSLIQMTFKNVLTDYRADSTEIFNLIQKNRFIVDSPFLYDSSIYTFTGNLAYDTAYLSRYDMQGNLLNQKILTWNFSDSTILIFPYAYGPTGISPANDSLLVFNTDGSEIQFVNRYTLNKVRLIVLDNNQSANIAAFEGWMQMNSTGFILDSNKVTLYGNLRKAPGFALPEFSQYYRMTIDYDGNILDKIHLGNTTVDNKGCYYEKINDDEYFVGSTPFSFNTWFSPEYRELLIFKVNNTQRDSVLIYGHKNYFINGDMVIDQNLDMFISTVYSNAWSDDSVFTVITKIPNALLVSVKEYNPKVSSILVYPNPTKDQLRVDGAKVGELYKVVSITGQLVLEGALTNSKTIDVGALKTGTYFLQLESQHQATYRANVFIKE